MADLTADKRKQMPRSEFGQPDKRGFPMNDKAHDRLAIGGATRAFDAGHISKGEEGHLKTEARSKLGEGDPKGGDHSANDHKAAVSRMRPEHLHKLVQDAHAGKFGPDAQKTAQAAMAQQPQGGDPQDMDQPGATAKPNYAQAFSPDQQDGDDDDQMAAVPASSIFAGSRGGR